MGGVRENALAALASPYHCDDASLCTCSSSVADAQMVSCSSSSPQSPTAVTQFPPPPIPQHHQKNNQRNSAAKLFSTCPAPSSVNAPTPLLAAKVRRRNSAKSDLRRRGRHRRSLNRAMGMADFSEMVLKELYK